MNTLIFPVLIVSWWQMAALKTGVDVWRVLLKDYENTFNFYVGR